MKSVRRTAVICSSRYPFESGTTTADMVRLYKMGGEDVFGLLRHFIFLTIFILREVAGQKIRPATAVVKI